MLLEVVYVTAWVPCSILLNHVTFLGWGRGGIAAPAGSDSCVQGRKQGKIEQKRVQLQRKTKGPVRVICSTHFSEEKLALRTKEDYFAYFMFSF